MELNFERNRREVRLQTSEVLGSGFSIELIAPHTILYLNNLDL